MNKHTGRFTRDGDTRSIASKIRGIILNPSKGATLILEANIQS
jgi:hypothetical protein